MKTKTAIIGASGYTGAELLRLLANHPNFDVRVVTANSQAGKSVTELYPHLHGFAHLTFKKLSDVESELALCDLVFCGLPHGEAATKLPSLSNKVIIDLGSDFRLKDSFQYPLWYGREHPTPHELSNWTYGLPELFKSDICSSTRIANPGCYATACILAVAPLLRAKLMEPFIVINAISGTTGAGREPSAATHFSHVTEDVRAYKPGSHQHTPEIEAALTIFSGLPAKISLTPHLAPMARGIFATCNAKLISHVTEDDILICLKTTYQNCPFVTVQSNLPGTKEVRGSNRIVIAPKIDQHTQHIIITSVIDNLTKGASGQAIQNANIIFGLDETTGLTDIGLYP